MTCHDLCSYLDALDKLVVTKDSDNNVIAEWIAVNLENPTSIMLIGNK